MATTSGSVADSAEFSQNWLTPWRVVALVAIAGILTLCWHVAGIQIGLLFSSDTAVALWHFTAGLFPPDVSPGFLAVVARALVQTAATAIAATLLSIAFAVPLAFLSTGTLWRDGNLSDAPSASLLSLASRAPRSLLGFLRAVPDLVWALLFVSAVGLGPLAGTLALAISYTGVLGRVYADVFEHVDSQPLEALASTGATRLQIFLRGVWPQAVPPITAYTLYSFECCVRSAAVLGFVGAGGIGYEIFVSMRLFEFRQVLTLLLALVAMLTATDALSRRLRTMSARGSAWPASFSGALSTPSEGRDRLRKRLGLSIGFVVAILSFQAAGFSAHQIIGHNVVAQMVDFVREMFPADFSWVFLRNLGTLLAQTIAMSVLATIAGIVLGIVLCLPATASLAFLSSDSPGSRAMLDRAVRWIVYWVARSILNVLRSIPELVWVLVCITAVGIGPFAGTIALGLHTAGVLGKLYAETMEEAPLRAIEALRSVGATPLQILLRGIWPQVRPMLVSYTVLRWEMNLRASTILGLVGGGGLGMAIYNSVQLGFYSRVSTLILVIYCLVLASDWMGERLRFRVA